MYIYPDEMPPYAAFHLGLNSLPKLHSGFVLPTCKVLNVHVDQGPELQRLLKVKEDLS